MLPAGSVPPFPSRAAPSPPAQGKPGSPCAHSGQQDCASCASFTLLSPTSCSKLQNLWQLQVLAAVGQLHGGGRQQNLGFQHLGGSCSFQQRGGIFPLCHGGRLGVYRTLQEGLWHSKPWDKSAPRHVGFVQGGRGNE